MSTEPFVGQISMVGFNFAPRGWALCNGQLLSISQNTALFSLLGTTYGGNGQTTFALPDMQSRVPMHWGQGPGLSSYSIGQQAGSESVTLLVTQIPAHTHATAPACNTAPLSSSVFDPANAYPGAQDSSGGTALYASTATAGATMGPSPTTSAGGSQPHDNIQPYLCVTFIIALEGIFPSRN